MFYTEAEINRFFKEQLNMYTLYLQPPYHEMDAIDLRNFKEVGVGLWDNHKE